MHGYTPVAQRIERRPPEPEMAVRFRPGVFFMQSLRQRAGLLGAFLRTGALTIAGLMNTDTRQSKHDLPRLP